MSPRRSFCFSASTFRSPFALQCSTASSSSSPLPPPPRPPSPACIGDETVRFHSSQYQSSHGFYSNLFSFAIHFSLWLLHAMSLWISSLYLFICIRSSFDFLPLFFVSFGFPFSIWLKSREVNFNLFKISLFSFGFACLPALPSLYDYSHIISFHKYWMCWLLNSHFGSEFSLIISECTGI